MNYFWHRFGILEKKDLRVFLRSLTNVFGGMDVKKLDVLLHFLKEARHFLPASSRGWRDAGVLCLCFQPSVSLERRTGELSSMKCQGEFKNVTLWLATNMQQTHLCTSESSYIRLKMPVFQFQLVSYRPQKNNSNTVRCPLSKIP